MRSSRRLASIRRRRRQAHSRSRCPRSRRSCSRSSRPGTRAPRRFRPRRSRAPPSAQAYLTAHYTAADLNRGSTLLRGVRTLSYLLGGKTLGQITPPGGTDPSYWCAALASAGGSCDNVDLTKTTVIGLDIMGQLG